MTSKVIMGAISFLLAVVLIGAAMTSYTAQSTTGWTGNVVTIWTLLPLLAILGVALLIFQSVRSQGN